MMDADSLHPCAKPDCRRLVSPGSSFCCGSCAGANAGLYELDPYLPDPSRDPYSMHTATCEAQHRERGPWRDPSLPPGPGEQGAADAAYARARARALGLPYTVEVEPLVDEGAPDADPADVQVYLDGVRREAP